MPPTPPLVSANIDAAPQPILVPGFAIDAFNWCQNSQPAAGSQASATRASSAGASHVMCGLLVSWIVTTALGAATSITVNVRDGSTGAGTILMTFQLGIAATVGSWVSQFVSGIRLAGSAGNAMTVEFSAAVASTQQSANFWGYDSN